MQATVWKTRPDTNDTAAVAMYGIIFSVSESIHKKKLPHSREPRRMAREHAWILKLFPALPGVRDEMRWYQARFLLLISPSHAASQVELESWRHSQYHFVGAYQLNL